MCIRDSVRPDHRHVAVDQAEDVPGLADAGRRPELVLGHEDLGVAGGARRRGHLDDVLVEAALRLVHGERGDALHRGAGRDQGHADALGAGLLGGRRGRVAQFGVVGQQHHLARVGPSYGLHQLPAGERLPGAREDSGRAGLGVQPRQALPGHDGDDGPLGALARGALAAGVHVAEPEVRDPDPVGAPGLDARLHRGTRVVDVHMDVPQPVAADHDEGVPEGVEPLPQPGHGLVAGFQEIDHLVGGPAGPGTLRAQLPLAPGVHARVDAGSRSGSGSGAGNSFGTGTGCGSGNSSADCSGDELRRHCGGLPHPLGFPHPLGLPYPRGFTCRLGLPHRLPRERLHQCPQHRHEPPAARVDHPGPLQHCQLARSRRQGRPGALVGGPRDRPAVPLGPLGGVGRGRGDRQHRALDRVGHGLTGGVGCVPQGQSQPGAVDAGRLARLARGEHLGHAPQQLGEDRPGVAPGPDERPVGHRAHGVGERRLLRARPVPGEHGLHGGRRRLQGQVQIRSGVPVGHRIDVDRVDLLARPPERPQRQTAPGAHRESIECLRHLRHLRLPDWLDVDAA